jgi:hypothetical protein
MEWIVHRLIHMLCITFKALILAVVSMSIGFSRSSQKNVSLRQELAPFVQTYEMDRINGLLKEVKLEKDFPALGQAEELDDKEAMPNSVQRRFRQINQKVFGHSNVVRLFAADGDHSAIHRAGREIGFPRDLIPIVAHNKTLLDFTLAHALSHYVYELYIRQISANAKSPHGHPSRGLEESSSETPATAAAHAEVDAIALAILLKMGHDARQIHSAVVGSFSNSKILLDRSMGLTVNDLTSFSLIPEDFRSRVQDNYVRFLSFLSTVAKLEDQG